MTPLEAWLFAAQWANAWKKITISNFPWNQFHEKFRKNDFTDKHRSEFTIFFFALFFVDFRMLFAACWESGPDRFWSLSFLCMTNSTEEMETWFVDNFYHLWLRYKSEWKKNYNFSFRKYLGNIRQSDFYLSLKIVWNK